MAKIYPKLANCHIHVKRLKLASKGLKIASSQKIAPIHFYYWRLTHFSVSAQDCIRTEPGYKLTLTFKTISKILVTWFKFLNIFNLKMAVRQRILEQYGEVWEKIELFQMVSLQFEFKTLSKPGKFISSVYSEQIKEITFNHVDSDLYVLIYILTYILWISLKRDARAHKKFLINILQALKNFC